MWHPRRARNRERKRNRVRPRYLVRERNHMRLRNRVRPRYLVRERHHPWSGRMEQRFGILWQSTSNGYTLRKL